MIRRVVKFALCVVGVHLWGVRNAGTAKVGENYYVVYECKGCGKHWKEKW